MLEMTSFKVDGLDLESFIKSLDLSKLGKELISFDDYQKIDDDSLRGILRGFTNSNPSLWETQMTNPKEHKKDGFQYVVHAVHNEHSVARLHQKSFILSEMVRGETVNYEDIDLLKTPENIHKKPIISTSLIDPRHRATWSAGGYILSVPSENILVTAERDIGTLYHKGQDLVTDLYSERDVFGIADPKLVLGRTCFTDYNEIVLTGTGRTGKQVGIEGVFVKVLPNGEYVNPSLARKLQRVAEDHNLPYIKIEQPFYPYSEMKEPQVSEQKNWFAIHSEGVRYFIIPTEKIFDVLEFGGQKQHPMTPKEREYVLSKVESYLVNSPNQDLQTLVEATKAVHDEVLLKRIEMQRAMERINDPFRMPFMRERESKFDKILNYFTTKDIISIK